MAFNVIFIAGTLNIVIPPVLTIQNGGLFATKEQRYTLPDNCDGVLAVNFAGGIQVFQDMLPINTATQHPDYVYLEYVVARNGVLISHTPLAGPFAQSMTLSSQTWASVSGPQTAELLIGGDSGLGNTWNGWVFNMGASTMIDVRLSRQVAPGFYCRFVNTTASGFRFLTDSAAPIISKVTPLNVTGVGSHATALCIGRQGGTDAIWFVTIA